MAAFDPPPRINNKDMPSIMQDWMRRFYLRVLGGTGTGTLWSTLDFTGSNITNILTRNHDNLQNISGGSSGQYNHLTTIEYALVNGTQTANTHLAGPTSGSAAVATFRALVSADIPHTRLSKSVAGAADVTLSVTEAFNTIMEFTGVLTGSISVIVPVTVRQWTIFNNTTGAFTLTVKTNAGTGIAVTQTKRCILYCDGTNVVRATSDV